MLQFTGYPNLTLTSTISRCVTNFVSQTYVKLKIGILCPVQKPVHLEENILPFKTLGPKLITAFKFLFMYFRLMTIKYTRK